ncbi:MAG: DUF2029 domain-containing protein [Deltaproteobacteria bacterium]|nr:DUF2029 domain-containing protein [Deltaproteobacteria bacterium]
MAIEKGMRRALVISACVLLGAVCVVEATGYAWLLSPVLEGSSRDRFGRVAGADFRAFHAAAHFAYAGEPDAAYDDARMTSFQRELFGESTGLIAWRYPPPTLMLIRPLGVLGYASAFALWVALGLLALGVAAFSVSRRLDVTAVVLLSPCVAFVVVTGQIGLFLAALALAGLGHLKRSPLLAGLCLGALMCKPHLALLVPVALLAGRQRRAFVGACVMVLALCLGSLALLGPEPWTLFVRDLLVHGAAAFTEARVEWARIPTTYILARQLGAGASAAWVVHLGLALVGVATLVRGWRRPGATDGQRALLFVAATLLLVPYAWDYDLVILLAPAVLIYRERRGRLTPLVALALVVMASVGIWLRFAVDAVGLQLFPLLWIALLAWGARDASWRAAAHPRSAQI